MRSFMLEGLHANNSLLFTCFEMAFLFFTEVYLGVSNEE